MNRSKKGHSTIKRRADFPELPPTAADAWALGVPFIEYEMMNDIAAAEDIAAFRSRAAGGLYGELMPRVGDDDELVGRGKHR